jgi:phosphoribosylpyrophosphate synthetase
MGTYENRPVGIVIPIYVEQYAKDEARYPSIPKRSLADMVWTHLDGTIFDKEKFVHDKEEWDKSLKREDENPSNNIGRYIEGNSRNPTFYPVPVLFRKFSDSSGKETTLKSVRHRVVYSVMSPSIDKNEHIEHICWLSDELKRSGADKHFVFHTYDASLRQEKRNDRESVNARWTADKLELAGVDRVFLFHPHPGHVVHSIYSRRCPVDVIPTNSIFAENIVDIFADRIGNVTLGSPDIGAYAEAQDFANMFWRCYRLPFLGIRKWRNPDKNDAVEIIGWVGRPEQDLSNRIFLLREDVTGSGSTVKDDSDYVNGLALASDGTLNDFRPESIMYCVTHADLCKGASQEMEKKAQRKIMDSGSTILAMNTVVHEYGEPVGTLGERYQSGMSLKQIANINPFYFIDCSPTIGDIIINHQEGGSMRRFLDRKMNMFYEKAEAQNHALTEAAA